MTDKDETVRIPRERDTNKTIRSTPVDRTTRMRSEHARPTPPAARPPAVQPVRIVNGAGFGFAVGIGISLAFLVTWLLAQTIERVVG
jgi:hypothetical protein